MQTTVGPQVLPRATSRPNKKIESADAVQIARLGLASSLFTVWRAAWHTFVARSLPMLSFALMALVNELLIGATVFAPSQPWAMLLRAVAGTLVLSFARGGISWLALHGEDAAVGFVAACRAALLRLPALMAGSLIYATVITTGAVGLGLAVRYTGIHVPLSFRGAQSFTLDLQTYEFVTKATKSFVSQSASAFIPDPGAPFSTWLPELRTYVLLRRVVIEMDPHAITLPPNDAYRFVSIYSPGQRQFWWITAASATLLLIAEVLLRLRTAFVMGADRSYSFTSLGRSLWFSVKQFGKIAVHIWLLRLCIFAISVLFIIVPVVLVQEIAVPKLLFVAPKLWVWVGSGTLSARATLLCVALVGMIFTTFGEVYVTRLYLLLATRADTVFAWQQSLLTKSPKVLPTPFEQFLPRKARLGSAAYPI